MQPIYKEYSFEKNITLAQRLLEVLLISLFVWCVFISLFVPIIVPIDFVLGFILYFYHRSLFVEYEYILLDHELSIDKIIRHQKRKHLNTFDLHYLKDIKESDEKINKSYISTLNSDKIIILLLQHGSINTNIRIHADKELLKILDTYKKSEVYYV